MRDMPLPDIVPLLRRQLAEGPVCGKTYSLFGDSADATGYYRVIGELADRCLERYPDPLSLLRLVHDLGRSRRRLRALRHGGSDTFRAFLVNAAGEMLRGYTREVQSHRASLPIRQRLDKTLSALEEQYHLAMLSIELANRCYGGAFRRAATKIAFLPHCLRDMEHQCKSEIDGDDQVCRSCTKTCWINGVSKLLRYHGITPYIWLRADLDRVIMRLQRQESGLGILGIACVLELDNGIRRCMRHGIPVVGIPLNANRCARWMGSFFPNSVSLEQLALLTRSSDAH